MQLKRKLPWILTGKALLAVASISMVALALVTYSATVTINFNPFFRQGVTTTTWATTTASGQRFMPGNTTLPGTPSAGTASSFAFLTQTGQGYVKVNLAAPVNLLDYQTFRIYVLIYNATWNNATMYQTSAFGAANTDTNGIDGTSATCLSAGACNVGYLHVNTATQFMYAIEISYTLVASPVDSSTSITFQYTPSLN